MDDTRWISLKEACDYLGVSRYTIIKWVEEKNLPATKIAKLWKFKKADIDFWMRNNYPQKS